LTNIEIYKEELINIFNDQHESMENTLIYLFTHHNKLPIRFINARHELTDMERNDVIRDVIPNLTQERSYYIMSKFPTKYRKYIIMHDTHNPRRIKQIILRFQNNYGADIWEKGDSDLVSIAVIKFFDDNSDPDSPKMGPYSMDFTTAVTDNVVHCDSVGLLESTLNQIMSLKN